MMKLSETFNTTSALAALKLVNKARQCAKRGDENGMFDNIEQACLDCAYAPTVRTADTKVANIIAAKVTHQLHKLYRIAYSGKCDTFVRHTQYLACEVHELIDAMQWERHGL